MKDTLQTFLFDNTDIRGAIVRLDQGLHDLVEHHDYAAGQQRLLAEFAAACLLLTSHVKFEGLLSLQARGNHGVSLVMAETRQDLVFRGIVRGDGAVASRRFDEVFAEGVLALTISPVQGKPYQGLVPVEGEHLGDSLAGYFRQSEQLPAWFRFCHGEGCVTAWMLQALPPQQCLDAQQREEDWQRLVLLAQTLKDDEMLAHDNATLLHRLFHQEEVRLFDARPARFECSCSRERMERGLLSLGREELESMLQEMEDVHTHCHFCNKDYRFSRQDIYQLLQGGMG